MLLPYFPWMTCGWARILVFVHNYLFGLLRVSREPEPRGRIRGTDGYSDTLKGMYKYTLPPQPFK